MNLKTIKSLENGWGNRQLSFSHQPCPDCGSSDALIINDDGSTKCFSCEKFTPAPKTRADPKTELKAYFIKGRSIGIPERNLTEETVKAFKYNTSEYEGRPCEIATYRNLEGEPIFQKVRFTDKKDFTMIGKFEPLLYGMHLFRGQTKKLIITEGEIDALSVYQAIKGFPVVSIPNGASNAKTAIKHNLKWIETFEEVVLCFDEDEAGQKAVKECAPLISVGKCKVMHLPVKDPNEMLKQGQADKLYKATWTAEPYRPDGVMSINDLWVEVNKKTEYGLSYPFPTLTQYTYGVRKNEMIVFAAGTGMGKTEFFKEIEHWLIKEHNKKIGIIHLEEMAKDTALGLMSKEASIPFHIPDSNYTENDFKKAFEEAIGTEKAYIYNGYGTTDFDSIVSVIRYFAKACDCEYIFLDHITAFFDGIDSTDNVNQKARNIILALANLTRELNIGLFAISHIKKSDGKKTAEEGGRVHLDDLYGSSALKQWVSFVFALERNQQAEDERERNTTTIRCLKDRYTGRALGKTIPVYYDKITGKLFETNVQEVFEDETSDF